MTNGWSGMGFALPAAIAAALNFPEKKVIAVCGDGGFLMSSGEVILARRLKLDIIFIILTDRELNLIKLKKEKAGFEHGRYDLSMMENCLNQINSWASL